MEFVAQLTKMPSVAESYIMAANFVASMSANTLVHDHGALALDVLLKTLLMLAVLTGAYHVLRLITSIAITFVTNAALSALVSLFVFNVCTEDGSIVNYCRFPVGNMTTY